MGLRSVGLMPHWVMVLLLAVGTSGLAMSQQSDPTAATTAKIVKARDYTEGYVAIAKDSFSKDGLDLQQARKLYLSAYSSYDAWVAYMKTALLAGRVKDLNTDSEYEKTSSEASTAATAFTTFVDSKTGNSKAATALLSSLGALGLQLWNGVKDERQKERQAAAMSFEQTVKWSPWEAITNESLAKPQPLPSVKPSGSPKPSENGQSAKPVPPTT